MSPETGVTILYYILYEVVYNQILLTTVNNFVTPDGLLRAVTPLLLLWPLVAPSPNLGCYSFGPQVSKLHVDRSHGFN